MSKKHKKVRSLDEINWTKFEHVKVDMNDEETKLILKLRPTDVDLPHVTLITELKNIITLQFCLYSWNSLLYPKDLLSWIIVDNEKKLDPNTFDDRVKIITFKGNSNELVKHIMNMENPHKSKVYTWLSCGDILYPDTLSIKHRAMVNYKKECVCPDSLAFYNPIANASYVLKLFKTYPKTGLYWKKSWWNMKNPSKVIGIPYIGNCVTIGASEVIGVPQPSSIRFFDNFPDPIKSIIKLLLQEWTTKIDEDDDNDDNEV